MQQRRFIERLVFWAGVLLLIAVCVGRSEAATGLLYACSRADVAGEDTQGTCSTKVWTTATPGKAIASCEADQPNCGFGAGSLWRLTENIAPAMRVYRCSADIAPDVGRTDARLCPVASRSWTTFIVAGGGGRVTVKWIPPTENTDGTPLTNLAGYRFYMRRKSESEWWPAVVVTNPGIALYQLTDLPLEEMTFAMTAFNAEGGESEMTETIDALPSVKAQITVQFGVAPK